MKLERLPGARSFEDLITALCEEADDWRAWRTTGLDVERTAQRAEVHRTMRMLVRETLEGYGVDVLEIDPT